MNKFNEIVSKMFKVKEADIRDDMTSKHIPDWDSMNYLLFIAELEREFDVSLGMDEVIHAGSIGDVKKMLRAKGIKI